MYEGYGYRSGKRKVILYDGFDWEITLREAIFSILILGILMGVGFLIHNAICKKIDDNTLKYRQAVSIVSTNEFRHAMDTDVGHAFVRGKLVALAPVKSKLVDGEWLSIFVKHQKYQMHTRTVTYTVYDSKGRPHTRTRTETYWSWDTKWTSFTNSPMVSFCGSMFDYGKFHYGCAPCEETVVKDGFLSNERDIVCTTKDGFNATIFAKLHGGSFDGQVGLVSSPIERYRESLCKSIFPVLFWVLWTMVSIGLMVGFYFARNDWLEG